jgi:hypothetical protein
MKNKKVPIWMWVIVALVVMLIFRECKRTIDQDKLLSQLAQYQFREKEFQVERNKDSSTIAYQEQTLLTMAEANKLGLLEMDKKMKSLQSQVKQKSEVQIVEKPVPFIPDGFADTTGMVRDEAGNVIRRDSIAVPTRFKLSEKWFNIDGLVKKDGLLIDTLTIPNKTVVNVGYKKAGFLNLGKQAVVSVKNENPYVNVTGLDNVVIRNKKKFWQSPLFGIGVGILVGLKIKK